MEHIDLETGIDIAINAIENGRLALICGAGLSMSSPSNIPSAQTLADLAKQKYDATYGAEREPLSENIEEQAALFFTEGMLGDYYLRSLIGPHAFSAQPNSAHFAVADFLLTQAADIAISTNVDQLIENAGTQLNGHVEVAIDRERAAAVPPQTSVLYKLHGCWSIDRNNTVWCKEQLDGPPLDTRIPEGANWLENRLLDRDIVVVGYFTHWDHLTSILSTALQAVNPARLVIVDPADADWLEQKSPEFFALGGRAGQFAHVQDYGDAFLDSLRKAFSRNFIRKALYGGRQAYHDSKGEQPEEAWLEPGITDSKYLWRIRRDLEGCAPSDPALWRAPANEPMIGLTILEFRAVGAEWVQSFLSHNGQAIRVFRGSSQPLHVLRAKFARVTPPLNQETIVAVGAVDLPLRANIARGADDESITRGSGRRWITRDAAQQEFGL